MIEIPWTPLTVAACLIIVGPMLKTRYQRSVTRTLGCFVLFATCFALATDLTALNCELVDPLLKAADANLGLDARAIAEWVNERRPMQRVSMICYFSFVPLIMLTLLVTYSERFMRRMAVCAIPTLLGLALVPALGNYASVEAQEHNAPIKARMLALSNGEVETLRIQDCEGIICAPSFHTIVGVLVIVAFWRTMIRWPVTLMCVGMIASTVPTGGHYCVDVLAGVLIAILVIWTVK